MKPRTVFKGTLIAGIITIAVLMGCATFETNAYRTLGTINATVSTLMDAFADEQVAGRTTPDFDDKVWKLYANYQALRVPARIAIDGYRYGTNTQQRVEAILTQVATNKEAIRQLVLSLVLTDTKKTSLQKLP